MPATIRSRRRKNGAPFWGLVQELIQFNLQEVSPYLTIKGQNILTPLRDENHFVRWSPSIQPKFVTFSSSLPPSFFWYPAPSSKPSIFFWTSSGVGYALACIGVATEVCASGHRKMIAAIISVLHRTSLRNRGAAEKRENIISFFSLFKKANLRLLRWHFGFKMINDVRIYI